MAAFGIMVGAAIPSQAAAMQAVALGGFLLVFLLSGLIYPIDNIPVGLRWLSNFIWGRYYIEIVRDALLQGGGWPATWYKVLEIARDRRGLLRAGVAHDAPHAGEGITMRTSCKGFSITACARWSRRSFGRFGATAAWPFP